MSLKYTYFNSAINNNKNILLIGNSPNVKEKELGKYININNFNVIRFNLQPTENYEQYIGSFTTYRIINGITWLNNNTIIPNDNIIIAEPSYTSVFQNIQKFSVNNKYKTIELLPDYTKNYTTIFPTSGLMAISFFLQFYDFIYIYGFSYDGSHFYENNIGDTHHNYKTEKNIILNLINDGKIIYLDEFNASSPLELTHNISNTLLETNISITSPIEILSINHAINNSGKYFHFNKNNINLLKGQTIYINAQYETDNINIVLWGYANGSDKGNSHGKVFDKSYTFKNNGIIKINQILPIINILSINHNSNKNGRYFNFDGNILKDNIHISSIEKTSINAMVYNVQKNIIKPVVIWNYSNGGTYGNFHGRYKTNPKDNDFYIGDLLVVIKYL